MAEIAVVGSFVQDLGFKTDTLPSAGETRIGQFQSGPGGKGFNQAIAARRAGTETLFVGAVGEDGFAVTMREFAAAEKVELALETHAGVSSGAASVIVNAASENMIVVALGANDRLSARHVRRCQDKIGGAKILICQLESSLEATKAALEIGRRRKLTNILNPAPINPGVSANLLALADILTPNETEFSFLLKALFDVEYNLDPEHVNPAELHALCRRMAVSTVVVTLGKRGAFVSHADILPAWASEDEHAYYSVDAIQARAVDSSGAGDAFTGGLACGLLRENGKFRDAVLFANTLAGISTERAGTAPSMPSLKEIEQRMKEN